jgi:DNA-binding MarR family transcriptional regulator
MDTGAKDVPRAQALDLVAGTLLGRASRLTRLLLRFGSRDLTRTEVGLLTTLTEGPRRVTELAETEALAQPSVSKLVERLEGRGLVVRRRSADDGRAILVSISVEGEHRLEATRAHLRSLLRGALRELSDEDLANLVSAGEVLERLVDQLQRQGQPQRDGQPQREQRSEQVAARA